MSAKFNDHPKWNFEEFTTFLLLYAAHADMELSPSEEALMKERIPEERYEVIKAEYDQLNDYDHIQLILSYKGLYFPTTTRRDELLDLMQKQFNADGDFSLLERNLITILKRLL